MPDTKPDLSFNADGVCDACVQYEQRAEVDWDQRRSELTEILDRYRSRDGSNYDCIVPVSGGKDSTFQTIRMLELGMNPLCVTATTDEFSDIGKRNLENLQRIGVDHIQVTVDPNIRARINRIALREVGDISWPEHVTIFTVPVRLSVQLNIPLIIWGENPQNEYGGPATAASDKVLTRQWLRRFGGMLGLEVEDLLKSEGIGQQNLIQYTYPDDESLRRAGVTGLFLGHFLPWDGWGNAVIAQAHGFETTPTLVEGSLANYENLDNAQTGIHDYFKYLKYGFGRSTDIACNQIRRGRLARADAIKMVEKRDGAFPHTCLGYPLKETLARIGLTISEFGELCDRFTNHSIFVSDQNGTLVRRDDGSPAKLNYDN